MFLVVFDIARRDFGPCFRYRVKLRCIHWQHALMGWKPNVISGIGARLLRVVSRLVWEWLF